MSKNTTNLSDLPCTCGTLEQYVDGLCPGCIEAADRVAELKRRYAAGACDAGRACHEDEDVREEREDRYYSGTGESMDDESYERYLNRG